jgi:hypothetical protein
MADMNTVVEAYRRAAHAGREAIEKCDFSPALRSEAVDALVKAERDNVRRWVQSWNVTRFPLSYDSIAHGSPDPFGIPLSFI